MPIHVTNTSDCNKLVIRITNPQADKDHEVKVTNGDNSITYTFPGGVDNTRLVLADDLGGGNGIYTIEHYVDGNLFGISAVLLSCDVLCCLASKMHELLDCDCECNKCSHHFVEAQKIFFLLKTAEAQLANIGSVGMSEAQAVIDNANRKYLTAQDMCAGHCGCNC